MGIILLGLMLIPLPGIVIDILLVISLMLCLIFISLRGFPYVYPIFSLTLSLLSLVVYISSTRLVMTQGKDIQSILIKKTGILVTNNGSIIGTIVATTVFLGFLLFQYFLFGKFSTRLSEVLARFALDCLPDKPIEAYCAAGNITEEDAKKKNAEPVAKMDFLGAMDGSIKFMKGNIKIEIFIFLASVVGGSLISIF
jgi:flagellar biosynthesis protein FlhA